MLAPELRWVLLSEGHAGTGGDEAVTMVASIRLIETTVTVNDERERAMARKTDSGL